MNIMKVCMFGGCALDDPLLQLLRNFIAPAWITVTQTQAPKMVVEHRWQSPKKKEWYFGKELKSST